MQHNGLRGGTLLLQWESRDACPTGHSELLLLLVLLLAQLWLVLLLVEEVAVVLLMLRSSDLLVRFVVSAWQRKALLVIAAEKSMRQVRKAFRVGFILQL